MTVSTSLNKVVYSGNGATTFFTFSFPGGNPTTSSAINVYYTDPLGNVTLLSPSAYTLVLNAPSGTNPTGIGGSVTYNPISGPIPSGSFLTILRTLPLQQNTSLANQGTLYQPVEEAALDYLMMSLQQVSELQGRALAVNVSDPTPGLLPTVAQRANLFAAYDSFGNPIAVQGGGANSPVSSAMAPVVNSSTLAAGRTAFGLGTMAVESIGFGLADNGSGACQVLFPLGFDSTTQTVTAAYHFTDRFATGNVTYNLPKASTLFSGFQFMVSALTGQLTFNINASDSFSGGVTGASYLVPAGGYINVHTDGVSTWYVDATSSTLYGMTEGLNLQLVASVSSSALTIAVKDQNGNDPSTASPVVVTFPNSTLTNGGPVTRVITTPLSITVPNGANLGTINGLASRIWIALFDSAGTPVLGVYNAVAYAGSAIEISSWDESSPSNGTGISSGSTSPIVWYTGSTISSKSFRILGYVDSTQPTAGAWTASPTRVRLMAPGVKKPGDPVQLVITTISGAGTTSSGTYTPLGSQLIAITPLQAANLVRVSAFASMQQGSSSCGVRLTRGTTPNTGFIGNPASNSTVSAGYVTAALLALDSPGTTSSTTYAVQGFSNGGTMSFGPNASIQAEEISA